jgi:hypothetical protein
MSGPSLHHLGLQTLTTRLAVLSPVEIEESMAIDEEQHAFQAISAGRMA